MASDLTHHAVEYAPAETNNTQPLTVKALRADGIKHVRIQWVDLLNQVRYRVVPLAYFEKLLQTSRPGISLTKAALGLAFITIVEGFNATGEYLYAIDLSTLRICPYAPGHASVMGWFEEKTPAAKVVGHKAIEVDLCPRTILRRVVEHAKDAAGVEFLVGFETEFILLTKTLPATAANAHGWCTANALPTGSKEAQVLEEIVDALGQAGIEVQMYHAEAAPGQYEVVTGPLPPLQAADALVHTRETIYNVASRHGLRATLAPRVFLDNCGSAAHAHISVHAPGASAQPSAHTNLSALEASFLAGLLQHLPHVALLLLPTAASYARVLDGVWSGGTYVCWGTDNREAPVRLCNAPSPAARNFELKTLDGTANPYLALAGVLGAGLAGVLQGQKLTMKDCSGELSAARMDAAGRAALGITERLPLDWEKARARFAQSVLVDRVFGADFKTKFLSVHNVRGSVSQVAWLLTFIYCRV
ncbi:hypothetical protein HYPSUDRAFT_132498 [Hypholoma sublateritium FD-334 SS-4]|uniref:Glutamine synthetase n=1 Tax=Hypholoma sublateritium (strain FD-334 SS-4) TaxID=945553 RepID=A0A0D2MSJ2_HYPSF|nr:hypothetical protein HYPSUDRAFT_132498 [Hypholoma sublateritium FD-334 SS-4]